VQTAPKLYRVELRLDRAEGTTPAWMVAALRAKYGSAELMRVESYGGGKATVVVRSGPLVSSPSVGDRVVPVVGVLQFPPAALPVGIVRQVSEIQLVQGGAAESIESSASSEQKVALRLITAAGILLSVVFLARKVKSK
jgi:hypothetical protein